MSQSSASESLQKSVRKYIFEHFEEHTTAPVLEQIMRKFGLDRAAAFKVLADLQSARHIALLTGTQRILMAFPFSSIVTPFRARVAGKDQEYFANCAWDAVAIHVALRKEQWISSYCHHCSEDIKIHLKDQRVVSQQSDNQPIVYLALPVSRWWENILLTCSNNIWCSSIRSIILQNGSNQAQ